MNLPQLDGILTVVTTPFDASGAVDYGVLGRHLAFLLDSGVHAIIPGGTTGEYYAQGIDDRRRILEFVADKVAGRVPLYAGTNSARPAETVELSERAADLGYEAVMLAAPYYSLPGPADLASHFRDLAAAIRLPIILYNFPARTGVDMDAEFLEAVRDVEAIFAIKESSGSMGRYYQHMMRFPHLQRVCGFDDQALDQFLWGSRSWIAGASNFLPAEHVALHRACVVERDWEKGLALMRAMMPVIYLLENGGKYIQYVKYGCELAGLPVGPARPPLGPLTDAEKAEFRRLYEALKATGIDRKAA